VTAVLTPVQTKQIRINIHKRNNSKTQYRQYKNTVQTIQKHSTNNTKTQCRQYKNTVQTIQKHSTDNTKTQYKQYKNTVQKIQKHCTDNTKHSKYKYTYYKNTHTLQNKLKQPQYKIHNKWNSHNIKGHPNVHGTFVHKNFTGTHSPNKTRNPMALKFYIYIYIYIKLDQGLNSNNIYINKICRNSDMFRPTMIIFRELMNFTKTETKT